MKSAFTAIPEHRLPVILAGARTPFLDSAGLYAELMSYELGAHALRGLLDRSDVDPARIELVIMGTVLHEIETTNVAREAMLAAGLPSRIPAYTVAMAGISPNVGVMNLCDQIALGRLDLGIAAGTENFSDVPVRLSQNIRRSLMKLRQRKGTRERLKVLGDLDSLGAGFQLASHDLDIRGAGNLLGDEQSGHVREVGFELYQSMLEDAIVAAKAGEIGLARERNALSPQITVDAPIMIPDDYVPDLAVRMALYRRLNDLEEGQDIEGFAAEMTDRFGPIPEPTQNLLKLIQIKQNALVAQVAKIEVGARGTLVSFHQDTPPNVPGLLAYVDKLGETAKLRPDSKLVINRIWGDPAARLNGCLQLSRGLANLARKAG